MNILKFLPTIILGGLCSFFAHQSCYAQIFSERLLIGADDGLNWFFERPLAGDFDQDGTIDIVYSVEFSDNEGTFIYRNTDPANCTFMFDQISGFIRPNTVAIRDMNNDGWPDVVNDHYIGVNQGGDTIVDNVPFFSLQDGLFNNVGDIGDINGDAYPDALYYNYTAFNNDRIGVLASTDSLTYQLIPLDSTFNRIEYQLFHDIDNDERDELIFAGINFPDEILVILDFQEDGSISRTEIAPPNFSGDYIGFADLTGDGLPDFIYFDTFSGLYYIPNENGSFNPGSRVTISSSPSMIGASFADIDSNDYMDIVGIYKATAPSSSFILAYWLNEGTDGTFESAAVFDQVSGDNTVSNSANDINDLFVIEDFDGNYFLDIVFGSPVDGEIYLYKNDLDLMNGTTSASAEQLGRLQVAPNPGQNYFELSIPTETSLLTEVQVWNAYGQLVYQGSSLAAYHLRLDTSNWPTGWYIAIAKDQAGEAFVARMLKQ